MFDLFFGLANSFYLELFNPQKRIFFGYLASAFLISLLWLVICEKTTVRSAVKKVFDKEIWVGESSLADFKILIINRIIFFLAAPALISQLAIATLLYEWLHAQEFISALVFHSLSPSLTTLIFTVTYFVIDDFSRFYLHRLMHHNPILWAFHQVHHSAETMTPFTIFRTHPVEGVLFLLRTVVVQGFMLSSFLFLFGNTVDLITIFGVNIAVFIFHALGSNLRHSHIKIRYAKYIECIFISPAQHQVHHSVDAKHYNKNFGVALAVWDLVFGSLQHSELAEHKFGVLGSAGNRHTLSYLYFKPFQKAAKHINKLMILSGWYHFMTRIRYKMPGLLAVAFMFLTAFLCVFAFPVMAKAAELNIYSHRQPFLINPFLEAFTKQTGIKTNVVFASKGLAQRLQAEGAASPADVILTVDIGRLKIYADKDLFREFDSGVLKGAIPNHLRSQSNTWFAFSKRSRVIAVSKTRLKDIDISRFEDLALEKWGGKICSRPGSHVYNRALLSSIIAANGETEALKWAKGLVNNFARTPRGNDRAQVKAVYSGECDIALINHYYYGKLENSSDPEQVSWAKSVEIIIPNQGPNDRGAHINISGGGIAKHSKNVKEAEMFMEFLVSEKAQTLFAEINYEYPVINGISLPTTLTKWGTFKEDRVPIEKIADLSMVSQKIIDVVGW